MRGLLLYAFMALTLAAQSWASEWKLVKHGGRDYVTLGNVASFYELGSIRRVGNSRELGTSDRNLRARGGSNELYINNLKFILSYPVIDHDGQLMVSRMDLTKVIEPVLRPSRIKDADKVDTIILDPGHGGHDRGATSRFGAEAHFTLDTALRTRDLLRRLGFKVYLTRESNVFIPLDARVKFANKFPNAIFVSIHYNSGQPGAAGVETYTLAPRGVPSTASDGPRVSDLQLCAGNSHDAANMALATATHASLVSKLAPFDRGIKRARFVVIRDIAIPGVLIEGGFLSNPGEASRVASAAYRQNLAAAIASALQNYRLAVSPRQTPSTVGPLVELNSRVTSPRRRRGVKPSPMPRPSSRPPQPAKARGASRRKTAPAKTARRATGKKRLAPDHEIFGEPPEEKRANPPIGVFDSGIGGLTVANALRRLLPAEDIFYIGDTARVPYGGKTQHTIERYSTEISGLLLAEQAKMIVVACNTASALAVPRLNDLLRVPVCGVIIPGAEAAATATRNGHIGVIGTRATIYSRAYEMAIHAIDPELRVSSRACPMLVPLIEEGWLDDPISDLVIRRYLDELVHEEIDTLVLGCTHYPMLSEALRRFLGPGIAIVDSAQNCALAVKRLLKTHKLAAPANHLGKLQVALTDGSDAFLRVAEEALGLQVGDIQLKTVQQVPG